CLVFVGLRWVPFVFVYVVIMVASTPVFGGHFIVDLLAGAGLAAVALWITRRAHGVAGAFGAYPKQD
ncbi:MAG: phosphatase PAP2 family protein, partial [Pikeienuella sp.]